jgi:hypothetical protein
VFYPGQFVDGTPPDNFEYLADDVTGKPQHTYVLDEAHPHAGAEVLNWIGQGPNDKRVKDAKPGEGSGDQSWPPLHPAPGLWGYCSGVAVTEGYLRETARTGPVRCLDGGGHAVSCGGVRTVGGP